MVIGIITVLGIKTEWIETSEGVSRRGWERGERERERERETETETERDRETGREIDR